MSARRFLARCSSLVAVTMLAAAWMPCARGQATANRSLVESLLATLGPVGPTEIQAAIADAEASLSRLRSALSEQALGVILTEELGLDELEFHLKQLRPEVVAIREAERRLRRIVPGRAGTAVNQLRASVSRLAISLSSTTDDLERARTALAVVKSRLRRPPERVAAEEEAELRSMFRLIAETHPSKSGVETLRRALSFPNSSTLIKRDFITRVSRQEFELPIRFRDCKDATSISIDGKVKICLAVELPPSTDGNRILVHATGAGILDAAANRKNAFLRACISPVLRGSQGLRILPTEVVGETPNLSARINTRLTGINLNGFLGRCDVVEGLAARIVEKKLAENDSKLSRRIEIDGAERVEEEGYKLAHRLNGLLRHGIWDRATSLDFVPDTRLWNDEVGARSEIRYERHDQLGALEPSPVMPPEIDRKLDIIHWIHESAVNNALEVLSDVRLDEATLRGLWHVEFKLTNEDWEKVQPARIPAAVTLASRSPVAVRFRPDGVEITLGLKGYEVDGRVAKFDAGRVRVFYRLLNNERGIYFSRGPIELMDTTLQPHQEMLSMTIERFFADSMYPLPKFNRSGFTSFFKIGHLNVDGGWLTVGISQSEPRTRSTEEVASGGSP